MDERGANGILPMTSQDDDDYDVAAQIPLTPSDSEESLPDEEDVPGAIPMPTRSGPPMSHATESASVARKTSKSQLTENMFSMTDDLRMRREAFDNLSSTAPAFQDVKKKLFSDRSGRPN